MNTQIKTLGLTLVAFLAFASTIETASASVVSVSGFAGPWDPTIAGNPDYGVHDNTAPTVVAVNAGDTITITYVSGLTSAFGGVPPTVDALGYVGSIFGSGTCCTGIGSSGDPFPSATIDPGNTGSQIALNALIGAFVDASGVILDAFATGDGPFPVVAPAGAVRLQLGVNDDIFADNDGALLIDVSGSTVRAVQVPEPSALVLIGLSLLSIVGFGAMRRRA